MRNIIVGTAGHIDHGKTALVRALTGVDTDRLPEEKRRGISIDLGFAHLPLQPDIGVAFIDVPGHERFVRNMLAGAAGIDLVLLVVAATESIKPQTREHFEICRLLGLQAGVVAITKGDLVDADTLELVKLEIAEMTAGSFLASSPMVAVSSTTGTGLPELQGALTDACAQVRQKVSGGYARLPIDRVFTIKGFGTVVTGTLISGALGRNQEVELLPGGRRLRIRGIEVNEVPTETACAGQRTAVNVMDIGTSEIRRGMVLAEADRFQTAPAFECRIEMLATAKALKSGDRVYVHIGAATLEARVRVRAGDRARIRLTQPALVLPGDRFILRSLSPVATIGGGVVVPSRVAEETNPARPEVPGPSTPQSDPGALAATESAFENAGLAGHPMTPLAHVLLKQGRLTRISPDLVVHRTALDLLVAQLSGKRGERFSVPDFKAWTGVSRKFAIPLLEYLDRRRFTRREGEARVVL